MADALKRAPQTIARHYRRAASLRLRELLGEFNCQRVPKRLFDFAEFAAIYKGATPEEIGAGLDADRDLLRLPQVFHAASWVSFTPSPGHSGDENSIVARGLIPELIPTLTRSSGWWRKSTAQLEADRDLTATWLDRFDSLARELGFARTQIWLIANEASLPKRWSCFASATHMDPVSSNSIF